jgi:hypothetical protein
MRLLRVALTDVRGVDRCEVRFDPEGVTVVEAPNESGKTTLLDAVDVLLEVKDSSNAQRVKDLQPADRDVPSTIEVELTCGVTHLTCTKTFNKQRGTVLTIHAPSPEVVKGTEAHDRLRSILEADVDLALYRALRFVQGRDLDAVALGDSAVLAARLDATAGGTGATDDGGLLDRAQREYLRWYTAATGRPGKELTALDGSLADAQAERDRRAADLAELDRDIDELTRVERDLPHLAQVRDRELVPGLEQARRQAERVNELQGVVATRRAERETAALELTAARDARRQRQERTAELGELDDAVTALETDLAPRRERLEELLDRRAASGTELTAAATRLADARTARDRAQRLADLVGAEQERRDLQRRQERITEVMAAARDAERALAGIQLDDARMRTIRAASQDLRVASATLATGVPTVRVHAHRPVQLDVDGTPAELDTDQQETWQVADRFVLTIPEVADVQVQAGTSSDQLVRAVRDAEEGLAEACREAGVPDVRTAEQVLEQLARHRAVVDRRDAEVARELDGRTVDELTAELREVDDRVAALRDRLGEATELPDPAAARAGVDTASGDVEAADDQHAELRAAFDELGATVQDERTALVTADAQLASRREQRDRLATRLADERTERPDADLAAAVVAAESADTAADERLAAAERELADLDPDAVELRVGNLEAQLVDLDERIQELRQQRAVLHERLRRGGEAGLGEALAQAEDRLERVRADHRRAHARAAAAKLLWEELTAARDEAYRAYRAPLRERIAAKARLLLGGTVEVELGDDLAIVGRTRDGVALGWGQLSAGAREQLAILAALSAAELAGPDGVPFVLDDALGYTDPDRLERIGALLGRTTDAQVIVLTCVADRFRHVGGARTVRLLETAG